MNWQNNGSWKEWFEITGADGVDFTEEAQSQIAKFNELGWDKLPICILNFAVLLHSL